MQEEGWKRDQMYQESADTSAQPQQGLFSSSDEKLKYWKSFPSFVTFIFQEYIHRPCASSRRFQQLLWTCMLAEAPSFQLSAETDWLSHLLSFLHACVLQDICAKSSRIPSGSHGRVASYKPSKELKTERRKRCIQNRGWWQLKLWKLRFNYSQ